MMGTQADIVVNCSRTRHASAAEHVSEMSWLARSSGLAHPVDNRFVNDSTFSVYLLRVSLSIPERVRRNRQRPITALTRARGSAAPTRPSESRTIAWACPNPESHSGTMRIRCPRAVSRDRQVDGACASRLTT